MSWRAAAWLAVALLFTTAVCCGGGSSGRTAGRRKLRRLNRRQARPLTRVDLVLSTPVVQIVWVPIPRSSATETTLRSSSNNSSTRRRNSARYRFGTATSSNRGITIPRKPNAENRGKIKVSTKAGQLHGVSPRLRSACSGRDRVFGVCRATVRLEDVRFAVIEGHRCLGYLLRVGLFFVADQRSRLRQALNVSGYRS